MKTNFHSMFIIFYIREISYKSQLIKSLPEINKQHKTTRIGQLQSNFALNVTFQKWKEKCLSYEMTYYAHKDIREFWWFGKLLNH